jgi:hypothetical protein
MPGTRLWRISCGERPEKGGEVPPKEVRLDDWGATLDEVDEVVAKIQDFIRVTPAHEFAEPAELDKYLALLERLRECQKTRTRVGTRHLSG